MILFSTIMLLNSICICVLDAEFILLQIPQFGVTTPDQDESIFYYAKQVKIAFNFTISINVSLIVLNLTVLLTWNGYQYLISAGIVVWRAWVLFPGVKFAKLTLIMSMIGVLGKYSKCHEMLRFYSLLIISFSSWNNH